MTSLKQHFAALATHTASMESHGDFELLSTEALDAALAECESFEHRLMQCHTLESVIAEAQGVNRRIAESFESYGLEGFDFDLYPIGSFTEQPSTINYAPSLEALDSYKRLLIAGGVGAVILLIRQFVKWLMGRKDSVSASNNLGATAKLHKDLTQESKDFTKTLGQYDRNIVKKYEGVNRAVGKVEEALKQLDTPPEEPVRVEPDIGVEEAKGMFLTYLADHLSEIFKDVFVQTAEELKPLRIGFLKEVLDRGLDKQLVELVEHFAEQAPVLFDGFEYIAEHIDQMGDSENARFQVTAEYQLHFGGEEQRQFATAYLSRQLKEEARLLKHIFEEQRSLNAQDDTIIPRDLSPTYAQHRDNADPRLVVREIRTNLEELAKGRFVSTRVELPVYDRELEKVERLYEKLQKGDYSAEQQKVIEQINAKIKAFIKEYNDLNQFLQGLRDDIQRLRKFMDTFKSKYNHLLNLRVKTYYERLGHDVTDSDVRKAIADILKTVKL